MVKRLKGMGASEQVLIDIYQKHVRSVLELAVAVWHGAISQDERNEIERVQKATHHIVLGDQYLSYRSALKHTGMDTLEARTSKLCLKFAKKAEKNPKHKKWFKPSHKSTNTRQKLPKYCPVFANKGRYEKSPISYLTNLLNKQ